MKEKTLLKVAIMCAIIGTAALTIIAENTELREINSSSIKALKEGDDGKLVGVVKDIIRKGNATIIKVERPETYTAVTFDNVEIAVGQKVSIDGEVQEYKGEKEIIARKVTSMKDG